MDRREMLAAFAGAATPAPFLALERAALMLQAENHPEPPFPGGTIATTPHAIATATDDMFTAVEEGFAKAAGGKALQACQF